MNLKTWIPLFFAVALALVAAKLTKDVIDKKKTGGQQPGEFVEIVVARGDIAPGAPLTSENLSKSPIPGKAAPAHTYTRVEDLNERVAAQPLVAGQPINEKLLAPKGTGTGLQAMIPKGFRAVTIEVDEFRGLSGMVAPGMNVDVVGTFRDESQAKADTVTRTVVQNLKVIAVGPRMTPAQGEEQKELYKSVTLLATPKDAEKVELAAWVGRPRLTLRSGRDQANAKLPSTSLTQLIAGDTEQGPGSSLVSLLLKKSAERKAAPTTQPTSLVEAPEKSPSATTVIDIDPFSFPASESTNRKTIEVIRGGVKSTQTFEVPREKKPVEPDYTVGSDVREISDAK